MAVPSAPEAAGVRVRTGATSGAPPPERIDVAYPPVHHRSFRTASKRRRIPPA